MKTGTIVKASPSLREISSRFLQAGLYTFLENTSDGCLMLDEEFNIVYLNETANQISQNTYEAVCQVGDNLLALVPLNHRERLGQILFDASQGQTVKVVVEFIKPDGSRIYTECKYAPIQTDQSFAGICIILKDISLQKALEASENEKKLIEARHQESLQLFQQFMEASPLRAWITDRNSRMHYINLLHQKFLGLTEDYKGKTLYDIFPEETARQYAADDQAALYASKPIEIIQKAKKPNGKKGIFKVYKFPVLIKNERMIAGWAIEITEQIRLQKELLKQEQKTKRKLIRSIITTQEKERRQFSVELHDNVNQIISSCKLMLEVAKENEPRRLELIEKSYQSLKEVIAEIRKISHDLNPSALEDIGLVEAISEMVERINVAGKHRGVESDLRERFRALGDLERILSRIALRSARPRDLATLRDGLGLLPDVRALLAPLDSPRLQALLGECGLHDAHAALLASAIVDQPPVLARDGGVFRDGYDGELDELRRLSTHADQFLVDLEQRERAATGIATLKVGYNRVHGYFIEISKGQAAKAPAHYTRRQTLTGAERYITEELKAFEDKVLSARERALSRERLLYEGLLDALNADIEPLRRCAAALGEVDVLACFAERAQALDWARPRLREAPGIHIDRGRHPVVEAVRDEPFTANDLHFGPPPEDAGDGVDGDTRMLVITGPNMGGKSTYMRQNALIVLLAHIGSFVPAARAEIGPIDRILTRIGAGDDLARGQSTFMVEMAETSYILHHATENSLVLMDEIGRGTSTYDGLALAEACARHLASVNRCYTLFATHYFELTALAQPGSGIANVHLDAVEHGDALVFMHALKDGPADRSFGLQVAALAGLPKSVVARARRRLAELEQRRHDAPVLSPEVLDAPQQIALFAPTSAAMDALAALEPDELTPKQALEALYRLKALQ